MRRHLLWLAPMALAIGCGRSTKTYPVTETSRPFSDFANLAGEAPAVTGGVTGARIEQARSEPQNWLTYYGAYDGQRYSPLDQINKETVKRLTLSRPRFAWPSPPCAKSRPTISSFGLSRPGSSFTSRTMSGSSCFSAFGRRRRDRKSVV